MRADAPTKLRMCTLRKVLEDSPQGYLKAGWYRCIGINKAGRGYYGRHRCARTPGDRVDTDGASVSSTLMLVGLIALQGLFTGLLYLYTTVLHTTTRDQLIQFLCLSPTFKCLHQYWGNGHDLATFWQFFGNILAKYAPKVLNLQSWQRDMTGGSSREPQSS